MLGPGRQAATLRPAQEHPHPIASHPQSRAEGAQAVGNPDQGAHGRPARPSKKLLCRWDLSPPATGTGAAPCSEPFHLHLNSGPCSKPLVGPLLLIPLI